MAKKTVVVTGIAGYWGERVAERLKTAGLRVLGIDTRAPDLPDTAGHFIHAALDAPELADILRTHTVSAVYHLPRTADIAATASLLSACVTAEVAQVVIKSSTRVYGASAAAPAHLPETHPLPHPAPDAATKFLRDTEALAASYRGAFQVTILRMAHIIGATVSSPLVDLLSQPAPVTLLGFDPLIQILHEDDTADALAHAIAAADGTFNIAASPPLPLSRIIALTGKIHLPMPHPAAYLRHRVEAGNHHHRRTFPLHPDFLRYRQVADASRMEDTFGYSPVHSAEETVQAFAAHNYFRQLPPDQRARVKRIKQMQNAVNNEK